MTLLRDEVGDKNSPAQFEKLVLYYSTGSAMGAKKSWPFTNKQAVVLERDPSDPQAYIGKLAGRPNWAGTIKNFFIDVHVPTLGKGDKGVKYGVYTLGIEFLK
jgi:hypothetical protein